MKSIRTKILVVVLSGLLLLGLLIGGAVIFATYQILHEDADAIMRAKSEAEASKINDILGGIQSSVQIVSEAAVEQLDVADSLLDIEYQQGYTRDMEILFNNAARNTKGIVAYYFRYNPDLDLPDVGFFYGVTSQGDGIQKLPVTDLFGDRESILWWHEPVSAGKAVWISLHNHSGFSTFSYVSPIYKDNVLIGVAGMDIQLSRLLDAVKAIAPYENGHAHLISGSGEELYRPEGSAKTEEDAKQMITSQVQLDNGMELNICAYYEDIQKEGRIIANTMALITLFVLIVFLLLTLFMTRSIVLPLRRLAKAATSMGDGSVLLDWECNLKDEIGDLYRVMNDTNIRLHDNMNIVKAQVYRDALTGFKNSTAYAEAKEELERQIAEGDAKFGILMVDINDLKLVNDKYGHKNGNQLIVRAAKMISSVFYRSRAYRVGGDEFVVILENADYDECEELLAQLDSLYETEYLEIGDINIPISIARGVAFYNHHIDSGVDNVFHRADELMYSNKREIKGR